MGLSRRVLIAKADDDGLYEQAREAVMKAGKLLILICSALKVGYARAARLLDLLEERAVGAGEAQKNREVFGGSGPRAGFGTGMRRGRIYTIEKQQPKARAAEAKET